MIKFRHLALIIIIVAALLLQTACQAASKEGKPIISTSIYPYSLILKQIVQDKADVYCIIPSYASPHTYSPLPEDIKIINQSDLVFVNGLNLESQFDKIFEQVGEKLVQAASYIPKAVLEYEFETKQKHEQLINVEHSSSVNPHIWLHPENIIDIARGFTHEISNIYPEEKEFFKQNLLELENDIKNTDRKIVKSKESIHLIKIISFHDSFYYFNLRYNIKSFGVIQKSPGQEPSPQDLKKISDTIIREKVNLLVTEPQFNPKSAHLLAEELKLKVVLLDPMGENIKAQKISELLEYNWNSIIDGLR
ncbi:MAG: metal ABC transporter substrate-binding protein [Candidatus Cloacimonadales bacterium]|jgi:zinc transport system substrate-binding protein|nr:metal ABC transporter substrate-binding protein [Candidatus Cloacimonadota bacterium]MDD3501527.1 metal ABC transporter substrate-binding protein [Candidatus Cloacimonadota bacterium]MDX9976693.1 metal ABC transporter substrate-binding protein [Candidatus Cloacimonadales bacterium]